MKWRLDPGQIEVVDEAMAAILRTKSPAERVAIAAAAHRSARVMLTARVGQLYPEWSPDQVNHEVVRRLHAHGTN